MDSRQWHCPTCEDERDFVQPPCVDGHTGNGGECPEWICADCGAAVVTGDAAVLPVLARPARAA